MSVRTTAREVPRPAAARTRRAPGLPIRFAAIWIALLALVAFCAVFVPRSLLPSTVLAILPLAAFLALAACGEALVLMARGIDLSIPAVITLASTLLLGVSGGRDEALLPAVAAALGAGLAVGLVNGALVAVLELNALIVTLAVGAVASGLTLSYRESLPAEARVPPGMAAWGDRDLLGVNVAVWLTVALVAVLSVLLRRSAAGRRFIAVGANPRAAWISGINVAASQIAAYAVAGVLYAVVGLLLAAFIRNPTLRVGDAYLLAPIAAAVLGGTAMSGGIGSMIAVAGAALFLTQLGQVLKMLGLPTALQFIVYGVAIALGMAIAEFRPARTFIRPQAWRRALSASDRRRTR